MLSHSPVAPSRNDHNVFSPKLSLLPSTEVYNLPTLELPVSFCFCPCLSHERYTFWKRNRMFSFDSAALNQLKLSNAHILECWMPVLFEVARILALPSKLSMTRRFCNWAGPIWLLSLQSFPIHVPVQKYFFLIAVVLFLQLVSYVHHRLHK